MYPRVFLQFDTGTVVIELNSIECPHISSLFLKLVKRRLTPNSLGVNFKPVTLLYSGRTPHVHILECFHEFSFDVTRDYLLKKRKKNSWGLMWSDCQGLYTHFWLTRDYDGSHFFGRVVQGEEILEAPIYDLNLLDYGVCKERVEKKQNEEGCSIS